MNRTFKAVIEAYHIEHFIKTVEFEVDIDGRDGYRGPPDYGCLWPSRYKFVRTIGSDNRIAIARWRRQGLLQGLEIELDDAGSTDEEQEEPTTFSDFCEPDASSDEDEKDSATSHVEEKDCSTREQEVCIALGYTWKCLSLMVC